jgi:hypothetical protein
MSSKQPDASTAPDPNPDDPTDSPTGGEPTPFVARRWAHDDRSVHQRIADARLELPGIGKNSRIAEGPQKYNYRSIEDVKAELGPLLGRHGVHYVATRITREVGTVQVGGKPWRMVDAEVEFTIYGANGDSFTALAYGEGRDNADKVHNKMHTGAEKNLLLGLFCIGDGAADPDHLRPEADADQTSGSPTGPWGTVKQAKFTLRQQVTDALHSLDPEVTADDVKAATAAAWAECGIEGADDDLVGHPEILTLLAEAIPVARDRFTADRAHADGGNGVDLADTDAPPSDRAARALAEVAEQVEDHRTAEQVIAQAEYDESPY